MILKKSRTVQITIRDTKDCFDLNAVPPSRVTKQVIGPRIPRSWLEHLDDAKWDVVDTMKLKVGFRKISLKRVRSVRTCLLNQSTARNRLTAIVM